MNVLIGLPRLNEPELDLSTFTPFDKGRGGELGAVVHAQSLRLTAHLDQLLE
jgi:hypothetical protein